MHDSSVVEIDLSAVDRNMSLVRRLVGPDCAICPVVKADAYGLGAVRIAKCLHRAGAEMFAVYTAEQAAELLRAALDAPILILMPLRDIGRVGELYRGLVRGRLHLAVHDVDHLADLARLAGAFALGLPVHLEVDTGMSRGGCNLDEAPAVLTRIAAEPRLRLAGIYTHFASAEADDALTRRQHASFERLLAEHAALIPEDCIVHVANTCATLRCRSFHRTMVRVGQAWAGYGPDGVRDGAILPGADDLVPCLRWASHLIHVKEIDAGTAVGYGPAGRTWTARRRSLIGLVPVGYADGYPLALTGPVDGVTPLGADDPAVGVWVTTRAGESRREFVPLAGRISMDQLTLDLTDLRGQGVGVGTPVELISPDRHAPNHLVRLAAAARTSPYEVLCRMNPRIRRLYHYDGATAATERVTPSASPATAVAV